MGKKDRKKKNDNRIQIPGAPPGTYLPPGMTLEQFQQIMQQKIMQQQMQQQRMAAQQRARAEMQKKAEEAKEAGEVEAAGPSSEASPEGPPPQSRPRGRPAPPTWFKGDDRHQSITIYPIYINKEKTVAGGRRIPKDIAVTRPHIQEMFLVLQHAGFKTIGLQKMHPRDTFKGDPCNFGRLHILFKNKDGTPIQPDIAKTKNDLLKYIAEKIPQLKSRAFANSMNQGPDLSSLEEPTPQPAASSTSNPNKTANKKRKNRRKR